MAIYHSQTQCHMIKYLLMGTYPVQAEHYKNFMGCLHYKTSTPITQFTYNTMQPSWFKQYFIQKKYIDIYFVKVIGSDSMPVAYQ